MNGVARIGAEMPDVDSVVSAIESSKRLQSALDHMRRAREEIQLIRSLIHGGGHAADIGNQRRFDSRLGEAEGLLGLALMPAIRAGQSLVAETKRLAEQVEAVELSGKRYASGHDDLGCRVGSPNEVVGEGA